MYLAERNESRHPYTPRASTLNAEKLPPQQPFIYACTTETHMIVKLYLSDILNPRAM